MQEFFFDDQVKVIGGAFEGRIYEVMAFGYADDMNELMLGLRFPDVDKPVWFRASEVVKIETVRSKGVN